MGEYTGKDKTGDRKSREEAIVIIHNEVWMVELGVSSVDRIGNACF